jgi:hypothetical protein
LILDAIESAITALAIFDFYDYVGILAILHARFPTL